MTHVIHGATVVDARGEQADAWVAVVDDAIVAVGSGAEWEEHVTADATVIDASGLYVVPGFVDMHNHGGGGASMDGDVESVKAAAAAHRKHGTTHVVASLVSNPVELLEQQLRTVREVMDTEPGVLGVHLEGPFLAPSRRGAHAPEYLRHPDSATVARLIEAADGALRQVTLAPELPGAMHAIRQFVDAGVVVAIGHTAADYETACGAFDRGATVVTHAFNAMNAIEGRAPGPITAACHDDRVTLEVIADGVHVNPAAVAMLFTLAPGRVALITDAVAGASGPEGEYRLGDLHVQLSHDRAVIAGTDTLAGSTLTQDRALRVVTQAGVPLVDAVTALTTTPARALGLSADDHLVVAGGPASLVILNKDLTVHRLVTA